MKWAEIYDARGAVCGFESDDGLISITRDCEDVRIDIAFEHGNSVVWLPADALAPLCGGVIEPQRRVPQRVQRRRGKGWKMPPDTVYVGRPTKWGNPHRVSERRPRPRDAVMQFREDLLGGLLPVSVEDVRRELKGKDLVCWCRIEQPWCHADVLLEVANAG